MGRIPKSFAAQPNLRQKSWIWSQMLNLGREDVEAKVLGWRARGPSADADAMVARSTSGCVSSRGCLKTVRFGRVAWSWS